jgi:LPXTG-site transpeptidase (sortase) family protein
MKTALRILLTVAGISVVATALASPSAVAEAPAPAGIVQQLRYIGRDPATGMPATVNDRFIADVARGVERYGKDEQKPVPPPPVDGADIVRLSIPKLGVAASVARFGLDNFGRLDVPQDRTTVGWNPGYSALPGRGAATFFAAHFEYAGAPGVFNRLSALASGDEVTVSVSDGSLYRYRVTSTIDYTIAAADMGALLAGREGAESLTLMTCSGPATADGYLLRTVVLAERVVG